MYNAVTIFGAVYNLRWKGGTVMAKDAISFKNRDRFIQMGIAISSLRKLRGMSQEQLAATLMPLGDYTKEQVRNIAREAGLSVAEKADSQEICFVTDGNYADFIKNNAKVVSNNITNLVFIILWKNRHRKNETF